MSDKQILNPSLIKPMTVADFNLHNRSDVRVTDTDPDGKVTEAHHFSTVDGKEVSEQERDAALTRVCGEMVPHDTYLHVTPEGERVLEINRNQAKAVYALKTKTGKTYAELRIKGVAAFPSYGSYDPSVQGCHYNKLGLHIHRGRTDSEIAVSYLDATGAHKDLLDLLSGKQTRVK